MHRRDMQWIVLFLILGALGFTLFVQYYDRAFPVASLNFRLTRDQAFATARAYVEKLGHDTGAYQNAQVFDQSSLQQVFLERTIGLEQSNQLVRDWLSVWYWHIRWFKPLDKEELRVRLDPGGRIVGFEHHMLESAPGARIAQEDARIVAENFLTHVMGFPLAQYTPIEAATTERAERTDHTFTYRKKDFTAGDDGHYRLQVIVQGDRIGSFAEFLKVPETFARTYSETRSRADLLTSAATVFWVALGIAMIAILMRQYRRGTLQWRGGLTIGIGVAIVALITSLNSYPLIIFSYNTTQSFGFFITILLIGGIVGSALNGGIVCLSGATGGAVARDALFDGRHNPLARFSLRNIRSAAFARSTLIGYGLAFAHLGYITLFYILGAEYLDVWAPAAMKDYSNTYSTLLPWIYPLFVGLIASTTEEFFFRLLAIPLLIQWTGRRWLAVLIPAVVWAFLHSNYPQEPIFIRGLELTVVGVIFGVVFLRYGIWATIVSHYVFNAFVGAYPMIQSDNLYFKVSGVLVIAVIFIPALPAIFSSLTGRYREKDEEMESLPAEPIPEAPALQPAPDLSVASRTPADYLLSNREKIIVACIAAVGIGCGVMFKTNGFGYSFKLAIDRAQAVQKAEAVCSEFGFDVREYQQTTWFASSLGNSNHTHLLREMGRDSAEVLVREETHPWVWYTRWFRPLQKEELRIGIDHQGRLAVLEHSLPEDREGADLTVEQARQIAESLAARAFDRAVADTAKFRLIEAQSEKRQARTDHRFVWERIDKKVDGGEFRVETVVQGDRVGVFKTRYKAPEIFLRDLNERGFKDAVGIGFMALFLITSIVLAVVYLLRIYRSGGISWRFPVAVGVFIVACTLISQINDLPGFYSRYRTEQILATFWGIQSIGMLIGAAFIGMAGILTAALAIELYKQQLPGEMPINGWFDVLRLKSGNAQLWLQAVFMGLSWRVFGKGMDALAGHVRYTYLQPYLKAKSRTVSGANTYLPFADGLLDHFSTTVLILFTLLALLLVWHRRIGRPRALITATIATLILMRTLAPAEDAYHFAILLGLAIPHIGILSLFVLRLMRFNLLAYICLAWVTLIYSGQALIKHELAFYDINGMLLLAVSLIPFVIGLFLHVKKHRQT